MILIIMCHTNEIPLLPHGTRVREGNFVAVQESVQRLENQGNITIKWAPLTGNFFLLVSS